MKRIALVVCIFILILSASLLAQKATLSTVLDATIQQVKAQQEALSELNTTQVKLQEQIDKLEQRLTILEQQTRPMTSSGDVFRNGEQQKESTK